MNLTQCFVNLSNTCNATAPGTILGLVNSAGGLIQCPQDIAQAAGMSYTTCKEQCGRGPESFAWGTFAQQFSAWLLPWLALVSQLPFGAASKHQLDNFESAILAVGSPMLAAYSLALTVLNGRWLARRFSNLSYGNHGLAFRVLSSLQQTPIHINRGDGLLASLIILPENDAWWKDLVERMDYTHTWSFAAASQITWVLIAYIFTVADAFTNLPPKPSSDGLSDGQAVGSVWLWLLPVVFGWLQISPKCDEARIRRAIKRANKEAYVATQNQGPIKASDKKETHAFTVRTQRNADDALFDDQDRFPPIFNYARLLPWTLDVETVRGMYDSASSLASEHNRVDSKPDWVRDSNRQNDNRTGSLEQVVNYCTLPGQSKASRWGRDIGSRVLQATLAAILLQWGTSMAAFLIVFSTPTVGLGCRSGFYMIYAAVGTLVWSMLLASTFLTHLVSTSKEYGYSRNSGVHDEEGSHELEDLVPKSDNGNRIGGCTLNGRHRLSTGLRIARLFAIALRRLAKTMAACNALWIVVMNMLTFGKLFNTCACNRATFTPNVIYRGFDTIIVDSGVGASWAGGVSLALGSTFLYIFFINMFINPSP